MSVVQNPQLSKVTQSTRLEGTLRSTHGKYVVIKTNGSCTFSQTSKKLRSNKSPEATPQTIPKVGSCLVSLAHYLSLHLPPKITRLIEFVGAFFSAELLKHKDTRQSRAPRARRQSNTLFPNVSAPKVKHHQLNLFLYPLAKKATLHLHKEQRRYSPQHARYAQKVSTLSTQKSQSRTCLIKRSDGIQNRDREVTFWKQQRQGIHLDWIPDADRSS